MQAGGEEVFNDSFINRVWCATPHCCWESDWVGVAQLSWENKEDKPSLLPPMNTSWSPSLCFHATCMHVLLPIALLSSDLSMFTVKWRIYQYKYICHNSDRIIDLLILFILNYWFKMFKLKLMEVHPIIINQS